MNSRREKLISSVLSAHDTSQSPENLDAVLRLILADMGQFFLEFHQTDGPGVMVFQPNSKEASMFYMPMEALYDWRSSYSEGEKDVQKIIDTCAKINPLEQACYLIVDHQGFRFLVLDYNKSVEQETLVEAS